jgi:hypothetical protein
MFQSLKTHTLPFTDYTGKTLYMVFQNLEACLLLLLFSFALYFTET